MPKLALIVQNGRGEIKKTVSQNDYVNLVYEQAYEEGDQIVLKGEADRFYMVQIDDAMAESLVYITREEFVYTIPWGEKKISYSPKSFSGELHLIRARYAGQEEIYAYRNLALNPIDQHGDTGCYPHAGANVETRGEAVFAARNAIDGVTENHNHGRWPYQSWGINRQDDAEIMVEFGCSVEIDKMILTTRADFPHDNWWVQGTFRFSDGTKLIMDLAKSDKGQEIGFPKKTVEWIKLGELIKGDDPSPFPALSQWEVFGTVK